MLLLGIETSCDDTAAAVVRDGVRVLANVSTNQDEFHAKYGGIVPEIASRRHAALLSASAKALAFAVGLPLYAVNHLHGHLFAPFLEREEPPPYPFLALLVSGGHTQLVDVESPADVRIIGRTRDDAAGEAFDKTARLLDLPFPGGPALDALARTGNPRAFAFPRHRPDAGTLDMSFSGLKTSVRYFLAGEGALAQREDVAASFQAAVVDVLIDRVVRALDVRDYRGLVLSGGVAANTALQAAFTNLGKRRRIATFIPELRFCTDNAAMIAAAADRRGAAALVDPRTLVADPNLPFAAA